MVLLYIDSQVTRRTLLKVDSVIALLLKMSIQLTDYSSTYRRYLSPFALVYYSLRQHAPVCVRTCLQFTRNYCSTFGQRNSGQSVHYRGQQLSQHYIYFILFLFYVFFLAKLYLFRHLLSWNLYEM